MDWISRAGKRERTSARILLDFCSFLRKSIRRNERERMGDPKLTF